MCQKKKIGLAILPRLFAFPLLAIVGQWLWMRYADPVSFLSLAVCVPALTYCWFCVGGLSHELIHNNLPLGRQVNHLLGQAIGISIGIPYTVYREIHMRHHAYLNTPLDWELWPYSDPKASLRFRRVFLWFDMFFGTFSTPLIYGRICFAVDSPVSDRIRRIMLREYAVMILAWSSGVAGLWWMLQTGRMQWRSSLLVFALPLLLAASCNSVRKVMEHIGTTSYEPLLGTRTVIGRSWLTKALSFFDFDLSVHGPHHRYPRLKHDSLKERMAEIASQQPDKQFPVFPSFTAALIDTFRTVIRNPAVGFNAGCTEDISHLLSLKESAPDADGNNLAAV